jgi:hypothetical protein
VTEPTKLEQLCRDLATLLPSFDSVHAEERAEELDRERPLATDPALRAEKDRCLTRDLEACGASDHIGVFPHDIRVHHPALVNVGAEELKLLIIQEMCTALYEQVEHLVCDGLIEDQRLL